LAKTTINALGNDICTLYKSYLKRDHFLRDSISQKSAFTIPKNSVD